MRLASWIIKEKRKHFIGFEPISEKICKIIFIRSFKCTTLVSVYVPRDCSVEEDKEYFSNDLSKIF